VPLLLHGHVHRSLDYTIGNTRVVCNPKGYANENPHFDPAMIVEVGEDYTPTMRM